MWAIAREARRRAGLTQRELARRAGTSQSAIARYERARAVPDLETLFRIVRACGLDLRIRLEPLDDHDDALIDAALTRTVEERLLANRGRARAASQLADG